MKLFKTLNIKIIDYRKVCRCFQCRTAICAASETFSEIKFSVCTVT